MPHRDIELHVHPRDPRGRILSYRLPPRWRSVAIGLLVAFVALLAAGIYTAPRAVRLRLSTRDYRAGVALRQELGERLQALVASLGEAGARARALGERTRRIARIYELAPQPANAAGAAGESDSETDEPASADAAATAADDLPDTIYARRIGEGRKLASHLDRELAGIASAVAAIEVAERSHPERAATIPVAAPLSGENVVLAGGFGPRRSPYTQEIEFHSGLDLAAPRGTPVVAPADGVVVWSGTLAPTPGSDWWRLGRAIVLRHGDEFRTLFGHLDSLDVGPGERVRRGETIGTVGDSGWTPAPALHFEIRRRRYDDWVAVDPRAYLLGLPAAAFGPEGDSPTTPLAAPGTPVAQPLPAAFRR